MSPDVCVVMAARNAAETVEVTLGSLADQTFSGTFEVILVDDASTDATTELARNMNLPFVRVVRLENNVGRAGARNFGIGQSTAQVIVIADADDVSSPNRPDFHWKMLLSDSTQVSGGQIVDFIQGKLKSGSSLRFPMESSAIDRIFDRGRMGIAHPASAFKRSWFDHNGGCDPSLAWCEDYDLFARGWAPGLFDSSDTLALAYRRRSKRVSWPYWWESQRYLAAINARLAAAGRGAAGMEPGIAGFLHQQSRGLYKGAELGKFMIFRLVRR